MNIYCSKCGRLANLDGICVNWRCNTYNEEDNFDIFNPFSEYCQCDTPQAINKCPICNKPIRQ